ncbi:hypothetical protein MnTg02_02458 [bacterium MnTg02]|nr:hypothetical protein MnTg02_02458 [bacterium MnTg02]
MMRSGFICCNSWPTSVASQSCAIPAVALGTPRLTYRIPGLLRPTAQDKSVTGPLSPAVTLSVFPAWFSLNRLICNPPAAVSTICRIASLPFSSSTETIAVPWRGPARNEISAQLNCPLRSVKLTLDFAAPDVSLTPVKPKGPVSPARLLATVQVPV